MTGGIGPDATDEGAAEVRLAEANATSPRAEKRAASRFSSEQRRLRSDLVVPAPDEGENRAARLGNPANVGLDPIRRGPRTARPSISRPGLSSGVGIFYSCNNSLCRPTALETAPISGDLFNRTALILAKAAAYQKRPSIILFAIDRTIYRVWLDRIERPLWHHPNNTNRWRVM